MYKPTIQKLLDENSQLILLMLDLLSKGKQNECLEHQRTLHRNLTYLMQFDPTAAHHLNNLPPPEAFIPNISQQRPSYSMPQNGYRQYSLVHPQQNLLLQQQWQNQSRMPIQQQQQQHILPQT